MADDPPTVASAGLPAPPSDGDDLSDFRGSRRIVGAEGGWPAEWKTEVVKLADVKG